MSHPEQLGFFFAVVAANRELSLGKVLEVGSYDVNGSIRKMFAGAASYVGVDLDIGPGVDVVSYGHQLQVADGHFDMALSGECLEHDPHWRETVMNMARMTRPGGLVAFTCASTGRPEHGTRRTDLGESPGTQSIGLDYYKNLSAADFEHALRLSEMFSSWEFWYLPTSFDLYFAGVRTGGTPIAPYGILPDGNEVHSLRHLMSAPHRLVRLPLHAAARLLPEAHYQSVALPYWRGLLRLQDLVAGGRFRRAGSPTSP